MSMTFDLAKRFVIKTAASMCLSAQAVLLNVCAMMHVSVSLGKSRETD